MNKKDLMIIVSAVFGVLLLNGIVMNFMKNPLLTEILRQQDEIMKMQMGLKNQVTMLKETGFAEQMQALMSAQKQLEQKFVNVAKSTRSLEGVLRKVIDPRAFTDNPPSAPREDLNVVHDIPVDHSVLIGPQDARVTIVEFVDFECPFCSRFHAPLLDIVKKFPQDVNYMIKNFPLNFHKKAIPAAKAALAAGEQGKYREMVDLILENGKSLNEEKYKELAQSLGLNMEQFMKDYKEKDAQWDEIIAKDKALAQKVGVRGTPTFFINGKKVENTSMNSLMDAVEKVLEEKE